MIESGWFLKKIVWGCLLTSQMYTQTRRDQFLDGSAEDFIVRSAKCEGRDNVNQPHNRPRLNEPILIILCNTLTGELLTIAILLLML